MNIIDPIHKNTGAGSFLPDPAHQFIQNGPTVFFLLLARRKFADDLQRRDFAVADVGN